MMFCQAAVKVVESSQIGEARREANRAARIAGLDDEHCGRAGIVATELATNLQRYGQGGELLVRSYDVAGGVGVELIAIDRGPGMPNVARCMEDGYSSGGTPGNGLGAVQRLASEFDIFSTQPGGTVVLARIQKAIAQPARQAAFSWGAINLPAPREVLCGDTWRIAQRDGELSLLVADGLGHGPLAAEAADVAATVFEENSTSDASAFFATADRRMRGTRGAAVAVACVNPRACTMKFTGVGNIAGSLYGGNASGGRGLVSHNGTVGAEMRKIQQFDYECTIGSLLIMHSDGLQSRWSFSPYPGLAARHPAIVASVLYRDFRRGNDDVTVCVLQPSPATAA